MTTLFDRRLLNAKDLTVRLALPDILSGVVQPDTLVAELDNTDGALNSLDLRGERFVLDRRDLWSNEELNELSGIVVGQTQRVNLMRLDIASQDLDDLQTLLPKRLVTAATFSNAHPTLGLNKPIPIIFGNSVGPYPLPLIGEDLTNNYYDYLLGEGTPTVVTIYSDVTPGSNTLTVVPSSEYSVNDAAYSGYRVIRFTKQQLAFSGDHYTIYATVNGLSTERNFARAVQSVLSNTTWGLGLSVNTASFDTAAADLDAVGSLYCDGSIISQRPAIDILNELLIVYGMILRKNPSTGAWTISVEKDQTTIRAQFGHGKNQVWQNVIQDGFKGLSRTSLSNAIKTLVLDYRWHPQSSQYQLTASRSVLSQGQERRIASQFIADPTTADKVVDFLSKRLIRGDQTIAFTGGQEARLLKPGDLIRYNAPDAGISDVVFQVKTLERKLDTVDLEGMGWDASIFTYTPGTLPSTPGAGTDTDRSKQTPTAASSLSIASSGTDADGQGGFVAYVVLQYTVPAEPWAQTIVRCRKSGVTTWETVAVNQTTGANLQTRINGLVTGMGYDYQVSRVNILNPALSTDATLSAQVTPGDTTAPSAPSAIAVRQGTGKDVEIDFTFTEPADWATTELYRNTSDSSSTATLIESKKAKRFHDVNISFGTTYYYWAKVVDYTGNKSSFSPSSSHSITPVQVQTSEVANQAITTPKRVPLSTLSASTGSVAVDTSALVTFNHNLGTHAASVVMKYSDDAGASADLRRTTLRGIANSDTQFTIQVNNPAESGGAITWTVGVEFF